MYTQRPILRLVVNTLVVCAWMIALPTAVFAQSSITGVVKDSSGAVLPGVTVEAASDSLIEKVRTAVSDGSGQYRIVDLRAGTYTVTFTLAGFNTFKREALELPTDFIATVNADMRVGSLQETITVTGESPIVDVQSAKRQRTIDSQLIQAIPSARAYNGIVRLIPSMTGGSNDVVLSPGMIVFGSRGGRANEGRVQVDGLNTGASLNGGGVSGYRQDLENATEVSVSTSGGMGEAEVGGIAMNIVPRTGGNTFTGHLFATGFNDATQASNYTDRIKTIGLAPGNPFTLAPPNSVNYNYETSFSSGGPIVRDRLWFFGLLSYRGNGSDVSMFHNKNAGDITKWLYEADPARQAKSDSRGPIQPNLRLTVQVTPRNKLNLFWDEQISSNSIGQGNATNAPETGAYNHGWQRVQQVKWTSTVTNKLLLEAGLGTYLSNWNNRERPDNDRSLIQVNEQCSAGCLANGGIVGLNYRGMGTWSADWIGAHTWNSAAAYITGSHSMKFGYQGAFHVDNRAPGGSTLTYRFNNGIPNRFTMNIREYRSSSRVRYNAFYAQDQWTRGRLTLSGGLRYDHSWSYYPEQSIGGTRFLPLVTVFPESKGVEGYNDISPRIGAVYDLFGTGKTALKFNTGRYLEAAVNDNGNYSELLPASRVDTSTNRTWTDNGNFNPDCDFLNPAVQDNRATGGDLCGNITEDGFGKSVPQVFYDPKIMKGWGVRPADWQIGVTVQHEVLPRVSVEVGYSRRWLQNFTVTDNLARAISDHTQFSVTAPTDSRLPGGGGYVVNNLFDPNQNVATLTNNFNTYAPNYGKQYSIYNGLELNLSARLRNGVQFQAGSSTGQTVTDNCEIRAQLPEISLLNPYCHNSPGITTRATGAASYTIPKVDVLVSGTFQSSPGGVLAANWIIPNATVRQWLGRDLSNQAANITVNLLEPGQMRGERVNQIDFRVGKLLRIGRQRATLSIDMFNLLNPDTILTYNQTYNPTGNWLNPLGVMTARTVKFTAQWDF
jgi:Carboxypeptidase regulatory-like domain